MNSSLLLLNSTHSLLTDKNPYAVRCEGFGEWLGDQSSPGGNRDETNSTWYTGPGCDLEFTSGRAGVPKIESAKHNPNHGETLD